MTTINKTGSAALPKTAARSLQTRPRAEAKSKAKTKTEPQITEPAHKENPGFDPGMHERIAEKAYELWSQRGGDAIQNWLDAETVICANLTHCRVEPPSSPSQRKSS